LIADRRNQRILVYSPGGELVREIKSGADGPLKAKMVGAITVDHEGNVLVFDPTSGAVIVFDPVRGEVVRQFQVSAPVADMIASRDGGVVTYFPSDADGAFKRFDRSGRELAAVHPARDERLRVFHARVQNGGIAQDAGGDIFGIEPTNFALVRLSPELKVREILQGAPTNPWMPSPTALPHGLSSSDYRAAHEAWFQSFTHIGRPFSLGPGIVMVTIYTSRGMAIRQQFANIYESDGRITAQGLLVPRDGNVVGNSGRTVYVVRNARLSDDDTMLPLELYAYELRDPGKLERREQ
jgi:hypothetical protein